MRHRMQLTVEGDEYAPPGATENRGWWDRGARSEAEWTPEGKPKGKPSRGDGVFLRYQRKQKLYRYLNI